MTKCNEKCFIQSLSYQDIFCNLIKYGDSVCNNEKEFIHIAIYSTFMTCSNNTISKEEKQLYEKGGKIPGKLRCIYGRSIKDVSIYTKVSSSSSLNSFRKRIEMSDGFQCAANHFSY